jgi:hypothetical protein
MAVERVYNLTARNYELGVSIAAHTVISAWSASSNWVSAFTRGVPEPADQINPLNMSGATLLLIVRMSTGEIPS